MKKGLDDHNRSQQYSDQEEMLFRNFYTCPQCGGKWEDTWTAMCDDDCPFCGQRHISPTHSEDA